MTGHAVHDASVATSLNSALVMDPSGQIPVPQTKTEGSFGTAKLPPVRLFEVVIVQELVVESQGHRMLA